MAGSGFTHSIAGGNGKLIVTALQSPNFIHGSQGWAINRDGSAEFHSISLPASAVGTVVTFASTAPASPNVGDVWYDTANGLLASVWSGTAWVSNQIGTAAIASGAVTGTQLAGSVTARSLGGITTTISATAPAGPNTGDIWINSAAGNQLNQWSGAAWTALAWNAGDVLSAGTITAGLIAANTITAGQIAANTITAGQIAANTITAGQIAANTITASQIQAGVVLAGAVNGTTITGAVFKGTNFIENSSGLFLYSGTPAAGNLIASIAAAAGTDGFGNAYPSGVASLSGGITANLTNGTLTLTPFTGGNTPGLVTSFSGTLILTSPTETSGDQQSQLLVTSAAAYAGASAAMVVGPTEIKTTVSIVADSWHNITADSGWTGVETPQYRLLPDGNVQLRGQLTHAGTTAAVNFNGSNPLPAAYQPAATRYYRPPQAGDGAGAVQVGTSGVIAMRASGFTATQIILDGIYSI